MVFLLHSLEKTVGSIILHVNADKTKYMSFNEDISTLNGSSLKLVDIFMYLSSSVWSTESDVNMHFC